MRVDDFLIEKLGATMTNVYLEIRPVNSDYE